MVSLETARLAIRNFRSADWEALHELIGQYEASGLAVYDQPWPLSPEAIRQVMQWFVRGDSYLAVCLKETDRCIGLAALTPESQAEEIAAGPAFSLGYIFNFDYHGQGYATEACRAVLAYAFERLQARQIVSGTAAANLTSCRLLERLGFQRTGESISSFRCAPDGTPIRFIGYSFVLTRARWRLVDKPRTA